MKHLAPRPQTRSFDFNILEIVGSKWKRVQARAVLQHGGKTAFRQDEHNVESFSSSGSLMLLPALQNALQRLPWCCLSHAGIPSM